MGELIDGLLFGLGIGGITATIALAIIISPMVSVETANLCAENGMFIANEHKCYNDEKICKIEYEAFINEYYLDNCREINRSD